MKHRIYSLLSILLIVTACSNNEELVGGNDQIAPNENNAATNAAINAANTQIANLSYARIGNELVSQEDVDKLIELQLSDLEWVKYDLRRKMLSKMIEDKLSSGLVPASAVQVLIEPPPLPRLKQNPTDGQPNHGPENAPITLAIYCSYPSTHCASMTKTYEALLDQYPEQIKLVFFDFPQAYHFNAGHAARAARCANEGGKFWPYHKGLLANFDQISDELFKRLARQVNLDSAAFEQCIRGEKYMKAVKENWKSAQDLGFGKVPVTLINGLFVNGPRSVDTMRYYIDKELERLGMGMSMVADKQTQQTVDLEKIPLSDLPLRLEGIAFDQDPKNASATIQNLESGVSRVYLHDEEVLPSIYLVMIESNSVIVEHSGRLERIILSAGQTDGLQSAAADQETLEDRNPAEREDGYVKVSKKSLADPDEIPAGLEYSYRGIVEPKGEMPLSRSWLDEKLLDREALQSHFSPAEHEVEGVLVMRLTNVQDNEFYQTLGLQELDVVLRVNNEWVHSGQNSLFDTLEANDELSVVVMRRGLPVHLKYAIN
jgi:protein-disulfide isomerase/type II secretory pathway component PulC